MAPFIQRQSLRARMFAAMVACLFLAQTTVAVAHLAALGDGGVVFGAFFCAPQVEATGSAPSPAPDDRTCQGLCCILHESALDAPPLKSDVSTAVFFPTEAIPRPPEGSDRAPRIEPKRAPQSPRAPPQQG